MRLQLPSKRRWMIATIISFGAAILLSMVIPAPPAATAAQSLLSLQTRCTNGGYLQAGVTGSNTGSPAATVTTLYADPAISFNGPLYEGVVIPAGESRTTYVHVPAGADALSVTITLTWANGLKASATKVIAGGLIDRAKQCKTSPSPSRSRSISPSPRPSSSQPASSSPSHPCQCQSSSSSASPMPSSSASSSSRSSSFSNKPPHSSAPSSHSQPASSPPNTASPTNTGGAQGGTVSGGPTNSGAQSPIAVQSSLDSLPVTGGHPSIMLLIGSASLVVGIGAVWASVVLRRKTRTAA